jgi:hypothetical protein
MTMCPCTIWWIIATELNFQEWDWSIVSDSIVFLMFSEPQKHLIPRSETPVHCMYTHVSWNSLKPEPWCLNPKVHHMHTHLSCNSLNPKPWCLNPKYTSLYTHLFCNFLNPNPWCLNPKYTTHIHLSCNSLNP